MAFLQAVAEEALRAATAPLQLRSEKRMQDWLRKWYTYHLSPLSTPVTAATQYHSGLTGVLNEIAEQHLNS